MLPVQLVTTNALSINIANNAKINFFLVLTNICSNITALGSLGNGVVTTFVPGMTTGNAFGAHPDTLKNTIAVNGLGGIFRTRWCITAG